ncbi:hypothetical protein CYMTET_31875 [Cymbomonas tetramitiformis]|uniref:Uncharacterized protein n=1 Tax=Cymbomonas tetramitiformis TaxID=36881 RepID=A0AAE0FFY9_9CHLO|nr:hypothetical protein CYMTET_31875 [Cymbomonas tetramitiformis]
MAKELLYSDVFAKHREEYNAEWEGSGPAYTLSAGAKLKPLKVSYEELPDPGRKSGLLAPLPATPSSTPIAGTSAELKPKKKKSKKKLDVHSKLERAGSLDLHQGNLRDLVKAVEEIVSEEPDIDSRPEEVPEPEESYEDDFEVEDEYADDFESDTDEVPQGMQSEVIKDLRRGRVSQLRSNCIDALGSGLYEKFYNFSRQKNGMQESGNFEDEQSALQAMKSDLVAVVGDKWGDYWCMLDEIIFYEDTAWRFQ